MPLLGQVVLELLRVPFGVGGYYFGVPVQFDNLFEILPVRRCGIRYVVITEPAFELVFVPFVIG